MIMGFTQEINELSRTVKPQYSVIHLNTRSLKQHSEQMCNLLDSISYKFDFIGCSETWFTSETDCTRFQIPGYTLLNENRTFSTGGGVALYVRSVPGSILMNQYPFYNFLSYFVIFLLSFFINNLKSFVIHNFKGHNISLSRCAPLLSFQYTM